MEGEVEEVGGVVWAAVKAFLFSSAIASSKSSRPTSAICFGRLVVFDVKANFAAPGFIRVGNPDKKVVAGSLVLNPVSHGLI